MKAIKKIIISLFTLFLSFNLFAQDYDLTDVPKDFIGTYIPVQLEMYLKEYMSYEKALHAIAESHYDILLLQENICYSQVRFQDGYAVKSKDFNKWSFVQRDDEQFILDENGLSYRKVSDQYGEAGYDAYAERVLSIIFTDAIHNKNISISGDQVTIYGQKYTFNLWPSYADDYGAVVLSGCVLKIEGLSANIYQTELVGRWDLKRTDKVVQTIPLFYWNDEDFEHLRVYKYKDSKKDLELLRNLIYAKHGYKFDSPELKAIFSAFGWYKVNPNFSEFLFSNYENYLLREISDYEKDL